MSNENTEEPQSSRETQEPQEDQETQEPRKKSPAPRRTRKTGTARKSGESGGSGRTGNRTETSTQTRQMGPMEVLRQARGQLAELTGREAESVSSFERTEEGWALEIEVLELERVPDTMSLMASYQVELDHEGLLTGYRRVRRYERGRSDARRGGGR